MAIFDVLHYFESINVTNVRLDGLKREERSLFDYPSFREAWVNACMHNDWNNAVSPSVYLFDDRIEIVSYGGIPFNLSREGFFLGTSVPVNKSLLSIFMVSKFAEQSGHGVPTIVNAYGREAFCFDDGMLKVTLPLAFDRDEVAIRKEMTLHKNGLSENQRHVLDALAEDGKRTLKEVALLTGLSEAGVKKICGKLQEYGILERFGNKKDGVWSVKSIL